MNKTILTLVALAGVAGAGVAVTLSKGECRDVLWTLGPDKAADRAEWTKGESRVCEGEESTVPEGATVVWESPVTSAKPLLEKGSKATLAPAEVIGGCACGPLTQPKPPCEVTEVDKDGKTVTRLSRPGEHLVSGTYSGGCVRKACFETAARKRPGDSVPVECGGEPVVEEPKGIEAKP